MDTITLIGISSMTIAGLTMAGGSIAPAIAQGRAIQQALISIAQQPDVHKQLAQTLFVGLAMIESLAIYCFVVAMILIFANPFWGAAVKAG
jgi:F-type H+-transporting ATPase subunit c